MRNSSLSALLCLSTLVASPAIGAINFSSDFDGSSPWNWTDTVTVENTESGITDPSNPSVSGTDQMVASFGSYGSNGDKAYAYTNLAGDPSTNSIVASFDLSFANIFNVNATNGEPVFLVGSSSGNLGEVSQFTSYFSLVKVSLNEDEGTVSFRTNARDRFWGTDSVESQDYSIGDNFRLSLDTQLINDDVVASLSIYANGSFQETVTATSTGHSNTPTDFSNFAGYALGIVDGGSNNQAFQGDLIFDNFTAAVPEPSTYAALAGLAALGLALYRRRS